MSPRGFVVIEKQSAQEDRSKQVKPVLRVEDLRALRDMLNEWHSSGGQRTGLHRVPDVVAI